MQKKIIPVIIAGGSGTRLWPLSRTQYPKQFLTLGLSEYTLLQATALRLNSSEYDNPIIICNEEHRFLVAEQMRAIDIVATIILEPVGKNTAPAVALAGLFLQQKDAIMLVLASDHVIGNEDGFKDSILQATKLAEQGYMVAFGVPPTYPETGYGYIKQGQPILNGYRIESFVEKPNKEVAKEYLKRGDFLWNSGMLMCQAGRYLEELTNHAPDIADSCRKAMVDTQKDLDFIRINNSIFKSCRSESMEYAIMEHTQTAALTILDAKWSDVGSWSALWDIQPKDGENNVFMGNVVAHNSYNNYIHSKDHLIAVVGVDNLVVVETKDVILVANKNNAQDIKHIVEHLKHTAQYKHDVN